MGKSFFIPCFGGKRSKNKSSVSSNGDSPTDSRASATKAFELDKNGSLYQNGKPNTNTNGVTRNESVKTVKRNTKKQQNYVTILKSKYEYEGDTYISSCKPDWEKPEVIPLILQHLKIPDLVKCRLVCKSWSTEASRLLRRNEDFYSKIHIADLREYTQVLASSTDNPMQSYQFHISNMRHPDIRYFFGQLGSTIISLVLNLVISEAEAFFNILPWMPNLRELMLFLVPGESTSVRSSISAGSTDKAELVVKLIDPEVISYLENVKTLIYCNYELKICQREFESVQFSLTSRNKLENSNDFGVHEAIVEEDENDERL